MMPFMPFTDSPIMLHRRPLVKAVESALRRPCGVEPGESLLIGVSGGADSVTLLRALCAIAPRSHWSLTLHIAHVNHHLRPDAAEDASFVAALAEQLDLPFHQREVHPADHPGNLEANARRARYRAMAEMADSAGARFVVTAHHADDQLETLLMRLIRGSSVKGMTGLAPRRKLDPPNAHGAVPYLIRPMLGVDHAAALAFLREIGQEWREDASNADLTRRRARLRAEVLPVLRDLRADAAIKAAHTARRLRDAERLSDRAVRAAERQWIRTDSEGRSFLSRDVARRLPSPLLRALIHRRSRAAGAPADGLSGRSLAPVVRAARDPSGEPRSFDLAGGVRIEVDAEQVRWFASG